MYVRDGYPKKSLDGGWVGGWGELYPMFGFLGKKLTLQSPLAAYEAMFRNTDTPIDSGHHGATVVTQIYFFENMQAMTTAGHVPDAPRWSSECRNVLI